MSEAGKQFSLATNQNAAFSDMIGLITVNYMCNRDANGYVYAVDNTPNNQYYSTQVHEGAHVRVGCSNTQSYRPPAAGESYGYTLLPRCCSGCIPSITGELVYNVGGHSYPEPGTGLFSCNCPTI